MEEPTRVILVVVNGIPLGLLVIEPDDNEPEPAEEKHDDSADTADDADWLANQTARGQ